MKIVDRLKNRDQTTSSHLHIEQNPERMAWWHPPRTGGLVLIIELSGWTSESLPLRLEQFGIEVRVVQGKEEALEQSKRTHPSLLIVGGDADLDFFRTLRRASSTFILALVPWHDESRMLSAFAAGVDDYQAGPVGSDEVVMRARALLRRALRSAQAPAVS